MGFNLSSLAATFPKPAHSFCQVPAWNSSADVFTRLFGRYGDIRSMDDQLSDLQSNHLRAFGPLLELTTLLGGACRLPVQQEVAAMSALGFSQAGLVNQITRLRRKKVLELFKHRSVCPKELLASFEEEILAAPSDRDLFTEDMVRSLKDFLQKIVEQRSQEEKMNQLLYKGKKRTLPHERSTSPSKRRKTQRGTSSTGRKKRRNTEDNQLPKATENKAQPFRGSGTKRASTRPEFSGSKRPATRRRRKDRYVDILFKHVEASNAKLKCVEYCSVRPEPEVHKQPRRPKVQIPTQSDTLYSSGGNYRPGTRLPCKGSDQGGGLLHTHDPIAHLPDTEGLGRRLSIHSEFEASKQSHDDRELQNGESPNCPRPGSSKRLDGQGRSKRRLLRSPRSTGESQIPGLSLAGQSLPIPPDAKRLQSSPSRIHETVETSGRRPSSSSHPDMLLSRRYFSDREHFDQHDSRPRLREGASHVPRIRVKRQEVVNGPGTTSRILRFRHRFANHDSLFTRRKTSSAPRPSHESSKQKSRSDSKRSRQPAGITASSRPSNSHRSPSLQGFAATEDRGFEVHQKLQLSGESGYRSTKRARLVAELPVPGEKSRVKQATSSRACCPYRDLYRQLADHVGRFLLRRRGARDLGSGRPVHAHQRTRTPSSAESSSVLHQEPAEPVNCPSRRQQDGPLLLEKDGGNPKSSSQPDRPGNMVMAPRTGPQPGARVHTNKGESSSGPSVPLPPSQEGVVSEQPGIRIVNRLVGSADDRSVCIVRKQKSEEVLLVGLRDNRDGSERIEQAQPLAIISSAVRIPTGKLDSKDTPKVGGTESPPVDTNSPGLENKAIVPPAPQESGRHPSVPAKLGKSDSRPKREPTSSPANQQPTASGMASFLRRVRKEGFSTKAAEYIRLRWRKGSRRTYESYWRNWVSWCDRGHIDPISPSPAQLGEYLVHLFHDKELATSSIGIARSAISSFAAPVEGAPLGEHRRICDLMKAFKNCRPPRARYSTTWSIDSLLSFWDTQHENSLLTLKLLTLKTVSLVAISSLSRADELANVLLENHSESEKGLSFILSKAPKNHNRGPIPLLSVEMIPGRPNICPVVAIREYMRRTQESREVKDNHPRDKLFLSLDSRHCNVKVGTISRWLQQAMHLAGIDTSTFKAHSIRGASVSTMRQRGCSIQQIIKKGRWKSNSVLIRFYLRTLPRY